MQTARIFVVSIPGSACTNPRTVDALVNVTRSISPCLCCFSIVSFKVSCNLQTVSYRGTSSTFNPAFFSGGSNSSDPCFARSSTIRLFGAASPAIASPSAAAQNVRGMTSANTPNCSSSFAVPEPIAATFTWGRNTLRTSIFSILICFQNVCTPMGLVNTSHCSLSCSLILPRIVPSTSFGQTGFVVIDGSSITCAPNSRSLPASLELFCLGRVVRICFPHRGRFFTQSNFSDNVQTFPTRMIAGVCT